MMENKNDLISVTESCVSSSNLSIKKSKNFAILIFKVKYETKSSQDVFVLGNTKELGFWNPENGLKMKKENFPFWVSTEEIKCNIGTEIFYKYVAIDSYTKEIEWESNMPNRLYKVENKGTFEIKEEKGNKRREINSTYFGNNLNLSYLNNKTIGTYSPIHDLNVYRMKDLADSAITIRGSICSSDIDENNRLINTYITDVLNYDQVRIDSMQKNPKNIGLKSQIEINAKEDKFIILTALLPFNIIKNKDSSSNKYTIVPKYEDVLYDSLFNIRKENKYEIHWFGLIDGYENFYNKDEPHIDPVLTEFLRKEKIYIINPTLDDYNNYWIYMSHIMGKIFYENKIPMNDIYFMEYEQYFTSYKIINELFAKEIINEANLDMLIMIHDINLSLVPHYIAKKNTFAKMGFYFNNNFPSLEVFKSLQFHEEILQSILLCNLICFHHIETAMKFLNIVQRNLDLYYAIKPGGKIIIDYQGRNVNIHIMQAGIDIKNIENCLKSKEFLENCEKYKKIYKNDINNENNCEQKEKEKYIFFSLDGLLDIDKIVLKLKTFDKYYNSYIERLNKINSENMEKIIEVSEDNSNKNGNKNEVKAIKANEKNKSNNKNIDTNNITIIDIKDEEIKKNKIIPEDSNINNNNTGQINKTVKKKKKTKKLKIKKGESKSGINLSSSPQDILSIKLKNQENEIYKTKEPLFIQIIKSSESKLMSLYNFSSIETQKQKEQMEINYKKVLNITKDINKKHEKEIIILINEKEENDFSLAKLYSIYAIGDCYYSLRKDYNFSLHIQSYVYISNYLNKSYNIIISENSYLTPGIKGALKVNEIDINQNRKALETIFSNNFNNDKIIKGNNIKFIKNNQISNWYEIFFSKLKKVSFYENDGLKKIYGFGLGFSLMRLSNDFVPLDKKEITEAYRESNQNLIIIDYITILQSFEENNIYQKENAMDQLKTLASQEKNKVYIISSNTKSELEQTFKDFHELGLACEYGFYYKKPREVDYHQLIYLEDWTWKQGIMPILNGFTERTEGSYILQKESMISWVYKNCESDFGQFQANEMISHIKTLLFQNDLIIVEDDNEKNMVNIRPKYINKGFFISEILKQENINGEFPDLIIGIGDRDGGEDMFKYLNYLKNNYSEIQSKIYTAIVGKRVTSANYYLNDASNIIEYIEDFNKIDKGEDNYSSKLSQDMYNIMEQSDEFELEFANIDCNY